MDTIRIRIDDKEVEGTAGMTILQAAEKAGVSIPTLCYQEQLPPIGSCRVCVVEVENSPRLMGACHTPIEEGMIIHTRSAKVIAARKITLELLLTSHTGPCVQDQWASQCTLHKISSDLEVGAPRFKVKKSRFYPEENVSPYVHRDLSKCILCFRCVKVCNELAGQRLLGVGYRAFQSKIVVDNDIPLDKKVCKDCYLCVENCPTSALTKARQPGDKKRGSKMHSCKPIVYPDNRARTHLLPLLKKVQDRSRYIPRGSMSRAADLFNLSLSDVYGVATFYSFLSTKRLGENVIRVCKSVPCYLRGAEMILRSIEDTLGIKPGQVTADKKFSLELVNCIGACDQAPAMLVNQDVYGNLTPAKISRILKQY